MPMKTNDADLESLKGLGPKSAAMLRQVGIHSREELMAHDPFALYARLKAEIPGISLNMLYALIGAVENRHWQDIKKEKRTTILLRLEQMGLLP